ncbi:MAG: sigma 54-interacting transcriptional regulator, partial [Gammaproteobacteria bacterium]|nr:sigma 54-interacting transcriptional regulator [Gammaproteobacteria bacterium]
EERTANLLGENQELKGALDLHSNSPGVSYGILGESLALKYALRQALQVANTSVTVLLTGESGTGKEKFSRVLHLNSDRKDESFLAINCAAIPEQLLESELFGHEKGAFTGASHLKKGKLELADGGTLFLDEIGDLSLELQSKLLRVLEKQLIQRVGGVKDIPVNVRIVAATHKDLQTAVNEGRFRLDLFYRLSVFPLKLPPLRERQGDTRILARYFLQVSNQEYRRDSRFAAGVMERLESYNWPGNIRQLENVIKRAVLLCHGNEINAAEIELILQHESNIATHLESGQTSEPMRVKFAPSPRAGAVEAGNGLRPYAWVSEDETETLLDALRQAGGNKTRAAFLLGMTPRQFRYRLQKLDIDPGKKRC